MTDMTSTKKNKIRFTAKAFAREVQGAPFDSGLSIHQNTIDELYDGSARIRLCLMCGAIEPTTKLKKENHSCAYSFKSFQVLVTTSWKKLEDFFLSHKYIDALEEIGVEIGVREVPTVHVETKAEVPTIHTKASNKVPVSVSETEVNDTSTAKK